MKISLNFHRIFIKFSLKYCILRFILTVAQLVCIIILYGRILMKQVYPAFILNTYDSSEHPFLVSVPDMDIFTEGDTFADAIEMARDAIGLTGISMEDSKEELPVPSDQAAAIEKAARDTGDIDFSKGILTYVDVDFSEYRRKADTKTVRRNVALPSWLNYKAEHAGINVSRVLQEALMNVQRNSYEIIIRIRRIHHNGIRRNQAFCRQKILLCHRKRTISHQAGDQKE